MLLARDQLGVFALAAAYVLLSAACGVVHSGRMYPPTSTVEIIHLWREAATTTIPSAIAMMLALWVTLKKDSIAMWGTSAITLLLVGYAFTLGCRLASRSHAEETARAIGAVVFAGTSFFVVHAYIMPIAAFWQWRLVLCHS
jgi:hypothetical protein